MIAEHPKVLLHRVVEQKLYEPSANLAKLLDAYDAIIAEHPEDFTWEVWSGRNAYGPRPTSRSLDAYDAVVPSILKATFCEEWA